MSKIIRTPTRAEGGLTEAEKIAMKAHAEKWIANALSTEPIDVEATGEAIRGIYAAAKLKEPRVVIVSSPIVMAAAYGASAAIWSNRKNKKDATRAATDAATDAATYVATRAATRAATYVATRAATYDATRDATYDATRDATYDATRDATYDATRDAMRACYEISGDFGVKCARKWIDVYQGGNMWSYMDVYLSAAREILGLKLPEHEAYLAWEKASLNSGFRVMHEEFCIVCDRPKSIKIDENNQPHCEDGPSHEWRDGWKLYHWHGVRVPSHWIEDKDNLTAQEVLREENTEVRAAGIAIIGMAKMLDSLEHKIVDSEIDPMHGDLIEVKIPDLPDPVYYLKAECPRNGTIMEAVNPDEMDEMTVRGAQAWRLGIPAEEFIFPEVRT